MMQEHAGTAGAVTVASTGLVGFMATATPYLQFACLCLSFAVGVLTVIWYVRRLRKDQ